jgi:hypothetical protein
MLSCRDEYQKPDDEYSDEETARRRDAVLKILLSTPPQPHVTRPAQPGKQKPTGAGRAREVVARQQKS